MKLISTILLLTFLSNLSAQTITNDGHEGGSDLFTSAMQQGDSAFASFDNFLAKTAYERAAQVDSTNCEVLWKLARAHIDAGYASPAAAQRRHYFTAENLARRCVELHPDSAQGHFFLAVALGRLALQAGGKQKIQLSKEIKAEAERTLALDPQHDRAMHVLGRWNYELGTLSWVLKAFAKVLYGGVPEGGITPAKEWFEKAIAVTPNSPSHHLWLGETLVKLKEYAPARRHLQECLRLPNLFWDDALNKKQAQRTLSSIETK